MAVISITATASSFEILASIPAYVELETNTPSTIYYTLDGSEPTIYSQVYLSTIVMPTDNQSVRLRAYAVSGSDSGTLDLTFALFQPQLYLHRRVDGYGNGIVIDEYGIAPVMYDGYTISTTVNADGYVVNVPGRFSDYEDEDLDIIYSTTGVNGIGEGTITHLAPMPEEIREKYDEIDFDEASSIVNNVYFNPKAAYIVIDGTDGYNTESTYPLLRGLDMHTDYSKYNNGSALYQVDPSGGPAYVGGFVKAFYSTSGKRVAYYFNHNSNQWIKSIQNYDQSKVPQNVGLRISRQPLVFKWIFGKRSGI